MYEINEYIAVHGLGEKGTHPLPWNECDTGLIDGWHIYDVRYLSDLGEDNPDALYALTIEDIGYKINDLGPIVICCGAGQSRSNAIAVGVLMRHWDMNYYDAIELVRDKVPISNIDPSHLAAIRRLYKVGPP